MQAKLAYTGMIGKELDLATGQRAARIAALNALAAARQHLGSLDRVTLVLKTEVWLVTTDDFVAVQPRIADGSSLLLLEISKRKGSQSGRLLGVASIALHAPVVVELLFEVEE